MTHLVGISGSLREASVNSAVLRAAAGLMPEGSRMEIASLIGIPLYDGDLEVRAFPPAVATLQKQIAAADGLFLMTPEYNRSFPGVLKNALDWLSRPGPVSQPVLNGCKLAIGGATPGGLGTLMAQNALLPVMKHLGAQVYSGAVLMVMHAPDKITDGRLTDEQDRARIAGFLKGFVGFLRA